jgi:hypothetical protein
MIDHDTINPGTGLPIPAAGQWRRLEPSRILKSPPFQTVYPYVINRELMEPEVSAGLEQTWKRRLFDERNIEVFQLNGGYIVGESFVVDENMQIIANLDDKYSAEEVQRAPRDIERLAELKQLLHYDGVGVVAKRRAANNYGHYLMYMVPLTLLGKRLFGDKDPRYVTHRTSLAMQDVTLRSLRRLGIGLDRVLMTDTHEPVHFEQIVFFSGLATHGSYMSPVAVDAVVEMAAPIPAGPHRKLFVRRIPGWREGLATKMRSPRAWLPTVFT